MRNLKLAFEKQVLPAVNLELNLYGYSIDQNGNQSTWEDSGKPWPDGYCVWVAERPLDSHLPFEILEELEGNFKSLALARQYACELIVANEALAFGDYLEYSIPAAKVITNDLK